MERRLSSFSYVRSKPQVKRVARRTPFDAFEYVSIDDSLFFSSCPVFHHLFNSALLRLISDWYWIQLFFVDFVLESDGGGDDKAECEGRLMSKYF